MKKALFPIENRAFFISRFVYPGRVFSRGPRLPVCCLPEEVGLFPITRPLFPRIRATGLVVYGRLGGSFGLL